MEDQGDAEKNRLGKEQPRTTSGEMTTVQPVKEAIAEIPDELALPRDNNDDDDDSLRTVNSILEHFVERLEKIITCGSLAELLAFAGVGLEALLAKMLQFALSNIRSKCKFRTLEEAQPFPDFVRDGDVVTTLRHESRKSLPWPVYIRQHWVDQFEAMNSFLENDQKHTLYVNGAQGCGKSFFLWFWARMAMKRGKRVLLIRNIGPCEVFILEDGAVKRHCEEMICHELVEFLENLLGEQTRKFDICIYDSMRQYDLRDGRHVMEVLNLYCSYYPNNKISKLILETSLDYYISLGDERRGESSFVDALYLDSWELADYEKVVMSDLIVINEYLKSMLLRDLMKLNRFKIKTDVAAMEVDANGSCDQDCDGDDSGTDADKVLEAVRRKFYYAGGCVRFMFTMGLDDFECGWQRVPPVDWLQTFNSKRLPLSKFIFLHAYQEGRTDFFVSNVATVATLAPNLTTVKSWVFELSQLEIIRSALARNKRSRARTSVRNRMLTFCPETQVCFYHDFDSILLYVTDIQSGLVIWSQSHWNQGCFDVVFYFDATLVTVQFTVATSHCFNPQCLKYLRTVLLSKGFELKRMAHVVVAETIEGFSLEVVSPKGPRTGNIAFSVEVATAGTLTEVVTSEAANFVVESGVTYDVYENE